MMLTRCPACQTVFRLRPEQLHARRGEVRCGHCFHPFNALEHAIEGAAGAPPAAPSSTRGVLILEDKPATPARTQPPASLLEFDIPDLEPETTPTEPRTAAGEVEATEQHIPAVHAPQAEFAEPSSVQPTGVAAAPPGPSNAELPRVFPGVLRSGRRPASLSAQAPATAPTHVEIPAEEPSATATKPSASPAFDPAPPLTRPTPEPQETAVHEPDLARLDATYGRAPRANHPALKAFGWLLTLALTALLGVQAAYLYRMEIARELPGLRPLLTEACARAGCTVPYPQDADHIAIEASDLQAEPGRPGHYLLHATLNNRAEYPQRWPYLELTLTDAGDNPITRRVLTPAQWLNAEHQSVDEAFPARRAVELRLPFEVSGLAPTGYRIYAFYP